MKSLKFSGNIFKYGDDVNTDVIIPARYLNTSDPAELASHCMEDIDASFATKVRDGDIIIAGENFGCGSSREHAPISIKAAGISCVIAKSFARIFYRNSFNIGLPIIECPDAVDNIMSGDIIEVDLENGIIRKKNEDKIFKPKPFPDFAKQIIMKGGLMEYVSSK